MCNNEKEVGLEEAGSGKSRGVFVELLNRLQCILLEILTGFLDYVGLSLPLPLICLLFSTMQMDHCCGINLKDITIFIIPITCGAHLIILACILKMNSSS
jgi:hypothetical protein